MTTTLFASHDSSTFVIAATPAAWLTDDAQLVICPAAPVAVGSGFNQEAQ